MIWAILDALMNLSYFVMGFNSIGVGGRELHDKYLVRDINSPIYFHQSTNICIFNKIWCYDYFNDAVKCILMPPQDLEKVG